MLQVGGVDTYYVESQTINLFDHERHPITVKGFLQPNSSPKDLPVLIVSSIDDPESQFRSVDIPSLSLSIQVPANWKETVQGRNASFTESGMVIPALSIFSQAVRNLPFDWKQPAYGTGSGLSLLPFTLLGKQAVVLEYADPSTVSIFIDDTMPSVTPRVLTFLFSPNGIANTADVKIIMDKILRSVGPPGGTSFFAPVSQAASGSAAGTFQPCGGSAGILCPTGSYCAITDTVNNTGRCTSL